MSYTTLAVLAAVAAVSVDVLVLRTNVLRHKVFWTSYAIILGCQLMLNGVLTGVGVVRYDPRRIVGWRIAYAPVEDLLFGFAMVTVTISLWVWWGRHAALVTRGRIPARRPAPGGPARPARDG
jgi:lycopene cyclase domain-containing protein